MPVPAESQPRTASLRTYLLLLVVGTMVPALLVAAFLVRRVVADGRAEVERRLLEAARGEAAVVDAELEGTIRALQGLAESNRLTDRDLPGFYEQAQHLIPTQPTWSSVTLLGPEGREILNTAAPIGSPLPYVTDRDSIDRAANDRKPAVGNVRVGQVTRQLGFPVRVPVIRDGRVIYLVSAWITSEKFSDVLRARPLLSDEWVRGVVDASGVIVARSRDPEKWVGSQGTSGFMQRRANADEGVYRDLTLEGRAVYGAFARAPGSRWIAGIAVPADVVDTPFRQSMIVLAAVSLLLVGVGGGGTYLISRRIARDISASASAAEAIAVGRDPQWPRSHVTELQRLLDALARSAELLATRQRERDAEVARADAARAEAEAADRAKDQFLAMLGHELRNPLAPALTALHLMKVRAGADTTRHRDVLERQIGHMARLVEDLLDISRLRRGAIELRLERVELADAAERAVEMTSPAFAEKQHTLDVDVPPGLVVEADRIRLAQVLANVLANAAKYTEPRGRIELCAREAGGQAVIECRDNGIGISADLVPQVFDLFVQGQRGLDRRQGGLGLGLAVARTLAELHGGTIEASSPGPDLGSTFTLRLPLAPKEEPIETGGLDQPLVEPMRIGRVLVVDDNHDALEMLLDALRAAGVDALGASRPLEALDLASRVRPQIVVLDIGLPDMDGFELARALRMLDGGATLRLVALTGYGREQDLAAGRAAGFDAFFVKPMDIPVLLEALHRLAGS